jgi:transcriptional regulator with XRE-family HTH domain
MSRSTHHRHYRSFLTLLRDLREQAGVTQVELGERLGNTQTFVSKIERGERRLDVVEFAEICDALGADPSTAFKQFLDGRGKERAGRKVASRRARTR